MSDVDRTLPVPPPVMVEVRLDDLTLMVSAARVLKRKIQREGVQHEGHDPEQSAAQISLAVDRTWQAMLEARR